MVLVPLRVKKQSHTPIPFSSAAVTLSCIYVALLASSLLFRFLSSELLEVLNLAFFDGLTYYRPYICATISLACVMK